MAQWSGKLVHLSHFCVVQTYDPETPFKHHWGTLLARQTNEMPHVFPRGVYTVSVSPTDLHREDEVRR